MNKEEQILNAYVSSGGLVFLALERIKSLGYELDEPELTAVIAQNLNKVQDLVKAHILMQTFQLTGLAITAVQGKLATMLPGDMGQFTTRLITQIKELTDKHESTSNINLNNFVWENLLDAESAEAIRYLQGQRNQPNNILEFSKDPHHQFALASGDQD